jgi:Tol biopolymer transport system component
MPWSPDGHRLAFTENLFQFFNESDIWVFDVAQETFTDLTDDGLTGSNPFMHPSDTPALLDYLPTWNPVTGDLYFFRSIRSSDSTSLVLYRIPAAGSTPEQVIDLTNRLPIPFPIFIPPAFTPDGSQMALIVLSQHLDDPANGVWVLKLTSNSITQVASLADLSALLPAFTDGKTYPQSVSWANSGIVIPSENPFTAASWASANTFILAMPSKSLTGLVDFTGFPDEAALSQVGSDGHSAVFRLPRAGVVTPDGKSYIYLHYDSTLTPATISTVSLPPDGSAPIDLGQIDPYTVAQPTYATISDDGTRAVMLGYLLTFG